MKIKEIRVTYSQSKSKNYNSVKIEHGAVVELDGEDPTLTRQQMIDALRKKTKEDLDQVDL